MKLQDYRKMKRAENPQPPKPKKKAKTYTAITILPSDIHYMLNQVKLIKSLSAYYDNGYRQWGNIAKRILLLKEIRTPFVAFRMKVREMDRLVAEINEISKKNSKYVYDYVRRFSYILEDIMEAITELGNAVSRSGVITMHEKHECISGNGKRLGLKVLISRTYSATEELKRIVKRLQDIADNN
ncbi:MAG: hypothetical protein IKT40_01280 [Bacilli bacterium]|nr:hypothetical protein [Bacilli bacterium]